MENKEINQNTNPTDTETVETKVELKNEVLDEQPEIIDEEVDLESRVQSLSPGMLVLKRFFRSKLSLVGLAILIALFAFCFIGPLFWSYGENEVFNIPQVFSFAKEYSIVRDGQTYVFYEISTSTVTFKAPPSWEHWLGTDNNGMDLFVRLMYGGRISLTLGFVVIFLKLLVGVILGGLAGYFGKWVDQIIMRLVDVFNCIPGLPIMLICSSLLDGWKVDPHSKIYWLMGILAFFGWSGVARLVRGQILSLREQEFMIAAEATGLRTSRKIFKHLVPNVMPQLVVSATLGLGSLIIYEATLSYLNLGVPFPSASWGRTINLASPTTGTGSEILQYFPNIWFPPGICIILAVLGFNFVGDGLRDALDPKMKR